MWYEIMVSASILPNSNPHLPAKKVAVCSHVVPDPATKDMMPLVDGQSGA